MADSTAIADMEQESEKIEGETNRITSENQSETQNLTNGDVAGDPPLAPSTPRDAAPGTPEKRTLIQEETAPGSPEPPTANPTSPKIKTPVAAESPRPSSASDGRSSRTKRSPSASSITKSSPKASPRTSSRTSSRPSSAQKVQTEENAVNGRSSARNTPDAANEKVNGSRESVKTEAVKTEVVKETEDVKESEERSVNKEDHKVESEEKEQVVVSNTETTTEDPDKKTSNASPQPQSELAIDIDDIKAENDKTSVQSEETHSVKSDCTGESERQASKTETAEETPKKTTPKRRLTKEEVGEKAKRLMEKLLAMERYDSSESMTAMKSIGRLYWDYKPYRPLVCDILLQMDFAGLAVKMLTNFNNLGIFKSDDVWFPAYYTLNNTWNYSDTSKELAKDMGEKGVIRLMMANITHQPYLDNLGSKNVTYVIKSSLSILQNISKVTECRSVYKELKVVEALKPFTTSDNDFFKATSMMTLTTLIDEAENAVLDDTGIIPFFVSSIAKALKSKNRRHRGFTPAELTECLGRMAVNDNNKMKIVEEGALPLFVQMLDTGDEEERTAVMRCIWTLSFDKDVRQRILSEVGCHEKIRAHTDHENNELRRAARGAMWKLEGEEAHGKLREEVKSKEEVSDENQQHIMISYNWANQDLVIKIANKLKADGYKVWLDVDQMGGSTLEAMAEAVENAAVVLICFSEKYKLSPNCRTEGEYTFQLKKPIVPVLMQLKYKADGWLGMLIGAKFFINFAGKYTFDKAYSMVVKELAGRGNPSLSQAVVASSVTETGVTPPANPRPKSAAAQSTVRGWTKEKVAEWLTTNGLESCKAAFSEMDGKLLCSLLEIREEAPNYFYKMLERKMELGYLDMLKLIDAFSSL